MANPEHLKILKHGVKVWNRWREENPAIRPDLAIADLENADLERANLAHAELAHAHFAHAHLVGARLRGAFMPGADLRSANLRSSDFVASILTNARLEGAKLQHAQLMNASLSDVDLRGADLGQANMLRTTIDGTNLSETLGLETVVHRGPSTIGTPTLELTASGLFNKDRRRGEIETFYRAAGIEEHIIEYFRSWNRPAVQFYSSFISYSHADRSLPNACTLTSRPRAFDAGLTNMTSNPVTASSTPLTTPSGSTTRSSCAAPSPPSTAGG